MTCNMNPSRPNMKSCRYGIVGQDQVVSILCCPAPTRHHPCRGKKKSFSSKGCRSGVPPLVTHIFFDIFILVFSPVFFFSFLSFYPFSFKYKSSKVGPRVCEGRCLSKAPPMLDHILSKKPTPSEFRM